MKATDQNPLPCEQFNAERASAQLEHEQEHERRARLARQLIDERNQEAQEKEADEAEFWKAVYVLMHIAAILIVLTTLYRMWGKYVS